MPRHDVVFYVSGHGLGHAARAAAVAGALRRLEGPRLRLAARSAGPAWLLAEGDPATVVHPSTPAALDPGAVQRTVLDVDVPATARAHAAFAPRFEARAAEEAAWLRAVGARVVVADVAPLGCAAAARAGIPALVVGNFGWDALLGTWTHAHPELSAPVARYREAYASALAVRLPLHAGIEAFPRRVDAGHVVRPVRRDCAAVRRALGLGDEARTILLVSLGAADLEALGVRDVDAGDAAVAALAPPPPGTRSRWIGIAPGEAGTHPELVAAADAVLAKPGYGTVAEALVLGTRFLALPREGWPETAPLLDGLAEEGCAAPLAREDFAAGRWQPALGALLARPRPGRRARGDGAARVAGLVRAHL